MKSDATIYILLIVLTTLFAYFSSKMAIRKNKELWQMPPFYFMLLTFAFFVGTRYMVGVDYENYMQLVEGGETHYYYDHIEYLNRLFVDLTNNLGLDFYWWFVFMALVQILFIGIAIKNNYRKVFSWIIFSFFLLYFSFYLNGVRQAAAISCFIYAVTFIEERKLYYYLIFIFIGSLFHTSILLWLPMYWIVNRELFKDIKIQYIILFTSIIFLPVFINTIVQNAFPILTLIGYGEQTMSIINKEEADIVVGSGLGVLFRYLRWTILIAYYNKLKALIGKNSFVPIYNLFFVGIVLDAATFDIIILNRVVMYCAVFELFVLGTLFYYMTKTKKKIDQVIIFILLILQIYLSFMSVFNGTFEWYSIWDVPYAI